MTTSIAALRGTVNMCKAQKRAYSMSLMEEKNRDETIDRSPVSTKRDGFGTTFSTVIVLLIAPIVALLLTAFVFQSYLVDGPSMETTLNDKDRLIVWKLPRTVARATGHTYIPNRGDIVIFSDSVIASYGQDPSKQLIKRVIGLPGDRVTVKNGVVTIYNKEHPTGFNPDKTLPYGSVIQQTAGNIDTTVGKDQVYAMGDNRPESFDSRIFGPVDAKNIIGKLVVRVWPLSSTKAF